MLVEGGLIVLLFTATERSMSLAILHLSQSVQGSRFKVDETVFFFEL
jgi:hypothetical protein